LNFHSECATFHFQQRLQLTARYSQERVTYNKEIQTADIESNTGSTSDEEVGEPIFRDREATVDPERALERLEEESATLDREIEEEIRGLSTFSSLYCPSAERMRRFNGGGKN
jgi:hypothetical protein